MGQCPAASTFLGLARLMLQLLLLSVVTATKVLMYPYCGPHPYCGQSPYYPGIQDQVAGGGGQYNKEPS